MGFQCTNSNEATKSNHKGYSKENMDNSSNSKIIPVGKEGRGESVMNPTNSNY